MPARDIFVVSMNTDFTEGRGAMVYHRTYSSYAAAHHYVMSQSGIFGSQQGLSSETEGSWSYNGYNIKRDVVLEGPTLKELLQDADFDTLTAALQESITAGATHDATIVTDLIKSKLNDMDTETLAEKVVRASIN